jgi:hypothetical protein
MKQLPHLKFTCAAALVFVICPLSANAEGRNDEASASTLALRFGDVEDAKPAPTLRLVGRDARQQLLATAKLPTSELRDFTRRVTYETSPADIVRVDKMGLVTPLQNGKATIAAKSADGLSATLPVTVEQFDQSPSVNFPNQIVPIFTKTGCNGGAMTPSLLFHNAPRARTNPRTPSRSARSASRRAPRSKRLRRKSRPTWSTPA